MADHIINIGKYHRGQHQDAPHHGQDDWIIFFYIMVDQVMADRFIEESIL
jgi:hypothetical protein